MSTNIEYSVMNNVLTIDGTGAKVKFQWPIADVLCFDDILVVRLEPDTGSCFNENVFGIHPNGTIAWTIEARQHVYDDSPYTSILAKDNKVKLFNWDGDELLVDPVTGSVISTNYGK